MKIAINFTDDELEMMKGWQGQCSDGAGENKSWTNPYWNHLTFEKDGIVVDENVKPFKGKSEKDIIENIGERFIEITEDCLNWLSISESYFKGDKRSKIRLGVKTANALVEKFGGEKDYFEDPTDYTWMISTDAFMKRLKAADRQRGF